MSEEKKLILVVEDEKALQEAISLKLQLSGFEVITAESVDDAKVHLGKGGITAIWLDHFLLGEKNGLDLVREIKQSSSDLRDIPIFVVSNTASDDKVQTYLRLGVTEYYVKAVNKLEQIVGDIKEELDKE